MKHIIFNQTISMLECISIAKKHIENNIAKNSSGTKDINNQAKLLNRIAEYAVLIFINRNYYKQFIITCDDEVMHYNKPLNAVIKKGLCLGEIEQSKHAEVLKQARKLINQLIGWNEMSYLEIIQALENGLKVYWINSAYRVFLENGKLYEINAYNESMCKLQESQYKDCFIKGV
mgnify:CR=1 FL=1